MALPSPRFSRKAEQPQDEVCEQSDEKQHFGPSGIFRLSVAQWENPSMTFEVTKGFFDFHTSCIRTPDEIGGAAVVW